MFVFGTGLFHEIRQALEIIGGATNSVFPQVEALLMTDTDYAEALKFVASRKDMTRYESIMDFFFCELHPEWQKDCRRYYAGMGPQLKELISVQQLMNYTKRLLVALEVARECLKEERRGTWGWYREEVEKALAA